MELGNESDNYSDEDFDSYESDQKRLEDEDRDDDENNFDDTVKKGSLGDVVNVYEHYLKPDLGPGFEGSQDDFKPYQFSNSFKQG